MIVMFVSLLVIYDMSYWLYVYIERDNNIITLCDFDEIDKFEVFMIIFLVV